ncbi:hypothetical protein [Actinopolymorpha singaporensis]|uniref:Uncharacterized protein n=1 Tax=Actinopolymorpha singaporensis TaxID=117157 RepID=A0A1H1Q5M1_9ACTN|nr:hypothetical protein [Actinopolymorpha singaporensis]SDS18706.1 hypothetical protein SAMN04489717_1891 [Actinopolymorpha singaporensis]
MTTEESAPAWSADTIGRRLRAFAEELEREPGPTCTVRRQWESYVEGTGGLVTELIPSRTDALAVTLTDFGSDFQLEAGQGPSGNWEIDERDDQAVEFIQSTVHAIIAGRVSEVFGTSRSRVAMMHADHSDRLWTDSACILPQPGWPTRGRKRRISPCPAAHSGRQWARLFPLTSAT